RPAPRRPCARRDGIKRRRLRCLTPARWPWQDYQGNGPRARETAMKKLLAFAIVLIALAALVRTHAAETVRIGILWPLTCNAAAAGQASKAAVEVATDIINNAHPEMANLPLAASAGLANHGGAKLELVFADHQ